MPEITVTLVDHTDSPDLRPLIAHHLADILSDLLFLDAEVTVVNTRWMTASPGADDQDLVLHFVNDVASSYVAQKMPGPHISLGNGGVTRPRPDKTGSEFYKFSLVGGVRTRFTATGYAKLAAHEAMHNVTRLDNAAMHPQGGIAGKPPKLPVNNANRTSFQAGLGNIPRQLL